MLLFKFKCFILYWCTADWQFMTVSGAQQSNSAIHTHATILPQTSVLSRLPHNTEQSSLCYAVGLCWLSILNISVCTYRSQNIYSLHVKFMILIDTYFYKIWWKTTVLYSTVPIQDYLQEAMTFNFFAISFGTDFHSVNSLPVPAGMSVDTIGQIEKLSLNPDHPSR